jgi:hypothetical protein
MTPEAIEEKQRCEKIIRNYLVKHQHDLRKTEMLKSILKKIQTPCSPKKSTQGGGRSHASPLTDSHNHSNTSTQTH